jgi:hypothetical protein
MRLRRTSALRALSEAAVELASANFAASKLALAIPNPLTSAGGKPTFSGWLIFSEAYAHIACYEKISQRYRRRRGLCL